MADSKEKLFSDFHPVYLRIAWMGRLQQIQRPTLKENWLEKPMKDLKETVWFPSGKTEGLKRQRTSGQFPLCERYKKDDNNTWFYRQDILVECWKKQMQKHSTFWIKV